LRVKTTARHRAPPRRVDSRLFGPEGEADDQAGHQADAEGRRNRLRRVVTDEILTVLVLLASLVGQIAVLVAEAVASLGGEVANGTGRLRDRRRALGGQFGEKLLDGLATLTGLLLNLADELIDVSLTLPWSLLH
jgi:hypothetical protein